MTELEETVASLRGEFKATFDEWKTTADSGMKAELLEKIEKIQTELAAKHDEQVATLSRKVDEAKTDMESKVRRFTEQNAQLPVTGPGGLAWKSLGTAFCEHPDVKGKFATGTFGRKDRIVATLNRRIVPAERKVITEAGSGFVLFPQRVGIFPQPPGYPLVMRDLFDTITLGTVNAVEYLIQTWTYNADYQVAEGDKKAESTVVYTEATANVRTIAHFVKISRQMMADVPYIAATIDAQLLYGLLKKEDTELLMGNNAAGHLHGVWPQSTTLTGTLSTSNLMDEIMRAITQVSVNGYYATNIVMNPADWGTMQIQKNSQGFYVLGGPPAAEGGPRLWGLPVTITPVMAAGTVLVAQFPATSMILDREQATVDVAYENEDDFIRNLVCIRAEERLALAVTAPLAYVNIVVPEAGGGGLR